MNAGPNRSASGLWVMLATAVIFAGACGSSEPVQFAGSRREPAPAVDGVSLPDVNDGSSPFEFRAEPGNILLVYFGYTSCPDVCPTTLADVTAARQRLGDEADRVQLAMATIDPDRDTTEVLGGYVDGFVPGGAALRTDDQDQLRDAAELFGVFYDVTTNETGEVEVLHTGTLFGVDDAGTLVASWAFGTRSSDLTSDLEILLGEDA